MLTTEQLSVVAQSLRETGFSVFTVRAEYEEERSTTDGRGPLVSGYMTRIGSFNIGGKRSTGLGRTREEALLVAVERLGVPLSDLVEMGGMTPAVHWRKSLIPGRA